MKRHRHRLERDQKNHKRSDVPVAVRLAWAKEQWRENPGISINGRDGMHQRMKFVFGVSAMNEQLQQAKSEVMAEDKPLNPVLKPEQVEALKMKQTSIAVVKPPLPPAEIKSAEETDWNPTSALKPAIITGNEVPPPLMTEIHGESSEYQRMGTGTSIEHTAERIRYARGYIKSVAPLVPTTQQVRVAVKQQFGIGLNSGAIGDVIREITGRAKKNVPRAADMARVVVKTRTAVVDNPHAPVNEEQKQQVVKAWNHPPVSDDAAAAADIKAAIEMLVEQVPRLRKLVVTVVNGKPQADYELEVVKVSSGKLEW